MCCSPLLNDATTENDDRRQGLSEHRHNHVIGHQSLGQKPSFYLGQDRWVGDPAPTPGYAAFMRAGVASIPATSMVTVLIASSQLGSHRLHFVRWTLEGGKMFQFRRCRRWFWRMASAAARRNAGYGGKGCFEKRWSGANRKTLDKVLGD